MWDFGDGTILTNVGYFSASHKWTTPGVYKRRTDSLQHGLP